MSGKEMIPVVKANAYGHGMVPIAKALVGRGSCHTLSVATLEEAIELRKKIPYAIRILVLSGFMPHQVDAFIKYRLTPVIHSLNHLKSLQNVKNLPELHLKIDTGMHRLGILPGEVDEACRVLERMDEKLSGLATHLADSESLTSHFADKQLAIFTDVYQTMKERKLLHTDVKIHVANTGGILRKKMAMSVAVRPGIGLYGISPNENISLSEELHPILEWKTRVLTIKTVQKRETIGYGRTYTAKKREKIANISIGYADGYPRLLSNVGYVGIGGKRVPVRGRVSMDLTSIDVSNVSSVREGSQVTLIGGEGKARVTAWDIAHWAKTIPYEILCGISLRVPRVYLD